MGSLSHGSYNHGSCDIDHGKKVVRLFGVNISTQNPEEEEEEEESMIQNHHNLTISSLVRSKKQSLKPLQERRKWNPWTKEEHQRFLAGLKRVRKGKWTEISKEFVPTKTPLQISTHAQKYFLRRLLSQQTASASASGLRNNKKIKKLSIFAMPLTEESTPTTEGRGGGNSNVDIVSHSSYVVEALRHQMPSYLKNISAIMLAQHRQQHLSN